MLFEIKEKGRYFVFKQAGTPSNSAKANVIFLKASCPSFIEPENWPPCSPYLSPSAYFMWSALERAEEIRDVDHFVNEFFLLGKISHKRQSQRQFQYGGRDYKLSLPMGIL